LLKRVQPVSTSGVNVSWLFIADYSGVVERESRKQQVQDKVACPVNRSGLERERDLEGVYLNSHRTQDKTAEILQI
jgi:hypothetical protein